MLVAADGFVYNVWRGYLIYSGCGQKKEEFKRHVIVSLKSIKVEILQIN